MGYDYFEKKIKLEELATIEGKTFYDDMIKCVIDIDKKIIAVNAGMHCDLEQFLLDNGSKQQSLYRINIRFDNGEIEFCKKAIEFLEIIKKDPKNEHRKEELDFRIGELEDYFLGDNRLNTTDDKLFEYYDAFLYDLF